ncbi:hypothetical protein Ddye_009891 [Dipteronia dyeriana]|uniref:Uncharacterized protein n=1 Tax=Dipteronia dyeriana TaxID=168575 RepID=A0AAD9XCA8_9ROSI|nr:hypothetical protein Ddye_009891 [Dipteronia dyeriana]
MFVSLRSFVRRCLFRFLTVGTIPNRVSFIMMEIEDTVRRKSSTKLGAGHKDGFASLIYPKAHAHGCSSGSKHPDTKFWGDPPEQVAAYCIHRLHCGQKSV